MIRVLAFLVVVGCAHGAAAPAAPAAPVAGPEWASLRAIIGTWQGSDPLKHSSGRFTLAPDLGGKVLVRRGTNESAQGHHEDLMVIEEGGKRATYWDNEGHVIAYAVTASAEHVEFLSDEIAGKPRFKLTYDVTAPDELTIEFGVELPGAGEFQHYTGGTVHRVR
ncbi:MAG: hypothetical protein JO257_17055 [Deltaproteobacteria bacterium]|nr:hypothetical protein [Deltaproteobacteria bacterium]